MWTFTGTIAPGSSTNATGVLQVFNTLYMEAGALTCLHADGVGNSSRLLVSPYGANPILDGFAWLAGVAHIDFSVGPTPGSYILITATGFMGTFGGFETNVPGLVGQLNYSTSQVTFTVIANDTIFAGTFEAPSANQSALAPRHLPTDSAIDATRTFRSAQQIVTITLTVP